MARILLIDDMPSVRGAIASVLKKNGHDVTEAGDGRTGVDKAAGGRFDLVITDIMMPLADGTEVIAALKDRPNPIPVIAMSGGGSGIPAEAALAVARSTAETTLTKPFENEALLEAVDALL